MTMRSERNKSTNWSIVPGFPEFFQFCEALIDQGPDELLHLSNLGRKVGDNSRHYPEIVHPYIDDRGTRAEIGTHVLRGFGNMARIEATLMISTTMSKISV